MLEDEIRRQEAINIWRQKMIIATVSAASMGIMLPIFIIVAARESEWSIAGGFTALLAVSSVACVREIRKLHRSRPAR